MTTNRKYIAADLETDGLLESVTKIHCCYFFNDDHEYVVVGTELVLLECAKLLKDGYTLVFHHAAYDVPVLRKMGLKIKRGQYTCSMVAQHKVYSGRHDYRLDALGEELVGINKIDYSAEMLNAGLWDGTGSVYAIDFNPVMHKYVKRDTLVCWKLWKNALVHFEKDARLAKSFFEIHEPFIEVIISMQGGIYLDPRKVLTLAQEIEISYQENEAEFLAEYSKVVKIGWNKAEQNYEVKEPVKYVRPNLGSPNDVASLMFSLGWEPVDYDFKTKRPKTNQGVFRYLLATLDKESRLYKMVEKLQALKAEGGIVSQLNTLIEHLNFDDFKIRANWKQQGTVTHRLACTNPNLMNISTRNPKWGKRMRALFTAPVRKKLLVGDFSQAELCILAYYLEVINKDSTMADAARAEQDFHDANTKAWFSIDKQDAEFKDKRKICKNGIFASNYGAAAKRLALTIGVTITEALEILNTVDERTTITALKERVWEIVAESRDIEKVTIGYKRVDYGVLYDCLGTRVIYDKIRSKDRYEQSSSKRKVFNALMQTGCFSVLAHCANLGLPIVEEAGGYYVALVHDEALIYVDEDKAEWARDELNKIFGSFRLPTPQGGVPVRAEFEIVNDWSEK